MKKVVILAIMFVLVAPGGWVACDAQRSDGEASDNHGTIVAVGDSLTEGLGVAEESAYPALLEKKLQAQGYRYTIVNAGVSGETSSGTLSRLNWVLRLKPDIVILVTGANDGLRGIDPVLTQTNLTKIVNFIKSRGITIVLGGMQMVQNLGEEYTHAFAKIYPEVARKTNVFLIPFFLDGVAGQANLNQPDGIHPTAEGYRIIANNLYPYITKAIALHERK